MIQVRHTMVFFLAYSNRNVFLWRIKQNELESISAHPPPHVISASLSVELQVV
jgi:hypothetical protein